MSEVMNYDPNLVLCGRMAKQVVRLTFGLWEYRTVIEVTVGGNCTGQTVIACAAGIAYETLEQRGIYGSDHTYATIQMAHPDTGEVMESDDDEDQGHRGSLVPLTRRRVSAAPRLPRPWHRPSRGRGTIPACTAHREGA